ncbi:MAG: DUF4270 family protein [Flavobacteriales bacterium]|nr:DUF4270 family protein [Flavobacteriales bacterium]
MIHYWLEISRKAARRAALLFSFSITVFVGCKEANDIVGENFIDKDLYLNTSLIDTLAVKTYTIKEDSLKIDSLSATLLGAIHDGDFGISSASAYLQILLREINVDFGTNPTIDSVVLSIAKHTGVPSYGSSASTNEMEVFQMAEIIQSEKSYYSNYKPKLGNKIGDWKYNLRLADTVWFEEDGQMNWLINTYRIRLDKSFGEDLVANGNFGSNEAFLQTLNGIAIVPKSSSLAVGEGSIVALNKNSDQSKLIVYYNGNLRKEFDITSESQNISSYEVVHTNTELLNQISNPGTNYSKCYVQSMAGCKMKIEIPGLLDLAKTGGEYAINEAEITFKLESGSVTDHFSAPTRLLLVQPSEVDGSNAFILDLVDQLIPPTSQWLGHTTYGGSYNASNQIYTFRFTRHLQQLFDEYKTTGNDNNRGFYLIIPSDNPITPSRAIINTGNTGTVKNLKVNIRYTKL